MALVEYLAKLLGREEIDPQADPIVMREIGDTVRRHAMSNPRLEPAGGDKADMFLMRDFLSAQQCRELIAIIDSRIQPSVLFSEKVAPRGRTSSTHFFAQGLPATEKLAAKIGEVTGLDRRHAEPLQGQRYRKGEEYRHQNMKQPQFCTTTRQHCNNVAAQKTLIG